MVKLFWSLIVILLLSTVIYCEEVQYYPFSKEEIFKIESKMVKSHKVDSLQKLIILKQKEKILLLDQVIKLDSLEIDYMDKKVELYKDKSIVKWYNNKQLWFMYGVSMTILTGWMVGQLR